MHAAIYQRQPPAPEVIIHTHSDAAVALSCLAEEALPPFHYMLAEFGGHDRPLRPLHHLRHAPARPPTPSPPSPAAPPACSPITA